MRKRVQDGGISHWAIRYPIVVQNTGSEAAPPYAVAQITNATPADAAAIYSVKKPDGNPEAHYVLVSPQGLGSTPGAATDQYPALAMISGSPSINQEIGPVNGSWSLTASGKGFVYIGGLAGGIGRVKAKAGTQAGDDFPLVKIVNNTGFTLPFGSIVGYGLPVDPPPITQFRVPTFGSAYPQAAKPFCVVLADIDAGATGDAGPVGVVACQINYTDLKHDYADAVNNTYGSLSSAASGPAKIIWREKQAIAGAGSLGLQWARVRLDWAKPLNLQWAEVYSKINAQTAWGSPGTGLVKFKKDDGTDDGPDPMLVENRYKFAYEVADNVLVDRGYNPPRVYGDKGGTGGGGARWGRIVSAASGSTVLGTPTTDGRMNLFAEFGGTPDVVLKNYYPDKAPAGSIGCIDDSGRLKAWSCGTLS